MITVDCHLHLGLTPSQVPEWWMAELMRFYGGEYYSLDGQVIVDLLDANGTDVGLVQGGDIRRTTFHPDYPGQHEVYVPNDYTASQVAAFPDRLLGVACIDPMRDVQAGVMEMERCITELDFRALKLLPSYGHYSPADRALDPIYEKALELDIPVHFFTGMTPIINTDLRFGDPVLLDEVGRRYRDLKVIVFVNYPWIDQATALVAKHPNFHADMCYFAGGTSETLHDALQKFRSYAALDRVIYGSDNSDKARDGEMEGPVPDLYRGVNAVAERRGAEPFSDAEIDSILGGAAARLYKINKPS